MKYALRESRLSRTDILDGMFNLTSCPSDGPTATKSELWDEVVNNTESPYPRNLDPTAFDRLLSKLVADGTLIEDTTGNEVSYRLADRS